MNDITRDDGKYVARPYQVPDSRPVLNIRKLEMIPGGMEYRSALNPDEVAEEAAQTFREKQAARERSDVPRTPGGFSGDRPAATPQTLPKLEDGRKYLRHINGSGGGEALIDVYDVCEAFKVEGAALSHCLKKILCPGIRGHKTRIQDLEEALLSLQKAIAQERRK